VGGTLAHPSPTPAVPGGGRGV